MLWSCCDVHTLKSSAVLTSLVRKLDKRRAQHQKGGHFQPKERVKSSASTLPVPADAPDWAVMPQTQTSTPVAPLRGSGTRRHLHYSPDEDEDEPNSDSSSVSDWFKLGLHVIVFLMFDCTCCVSNFGFCCESAVNDLALMPKSGSENGKWDCNNNGGVRTSTDL